jgi:hypothetical protein
LPGYQIKQGGAGQHKLRAGDQPRQHQRKSQQQHDVERQHVQVGRPEHQDQGMDQRQRRVLEIAGDAHFLAEQRVVEHPRRIGHLGGEREEQEHNRNI